MQIPSSYLSRIRQLHPGLPLDSLDFNQDGMVNDVVIVDGVLVCRFPKHGWAWAAPEHEARVLGLARRHITLPVPAFERLEHDVASYRFLPGEPLTRDTLLRVLADVALPASAPRRPADRGSGRRGRRVRRP